jgi:hypothetical protein
MGGLGSGGHNRSGRATVEGIRAIEVGKLHRAGALEAGRTSSCSWSQDGERLADIGIIGGRDQIRLVYRVRRGEGPWQEIDEAVGLVWRPCPFGGERPLFCCPGCRRPVLKLYGANSRFLCRHCYRLTYASRRERESNRAQRRADKLRRQLGGEPGWQMPPAPRPKGMHHRTYERLAREIDRLDGVTDDYAALLLGRLERRCGPGAGDFWR